MERVNKDISFYYKHQDKKSHVNITKAAIEVAEICLQANIDMKKMVAKAMAAVECLSVLNNFITTQRRERIKPTFSEAVKNMCEREDYGDSDISLEMICQQSLNRPKNRTLWEKLCHHPLLTILTERGNTMTKMRIRAPTDVRHHLTRDLRVTTIYTGMAEKKNYGAPNQNSSYRNSSNRQGKAQNLGLGYFKEHLAHMFPHPWSA